jgi:predicted pyridoxine 5'-phosphate oxidase superfamily flavin-nucleotide-binding protein
MTSPRPLGLRKPVGWGHDESPFHEGEQRVQQRIGVRERVEHMGRNLVRDAMPLEHREFFEKLPFLVVGSSDAAGAVWASLLLGEPGFVAAPTAKSLLVRAQPLPADPLADNLRAGAPLGLLGIELETRRRNRANGHVAWVSDNGFELLVDQSFGNCKQYIQARAGAFAGPDARKAPTVEGARLSAPALELLSRTDTSFIASASRDASQGGAEGVDVSHRGGRPGFIRAELTERGTRLTLPDFYGNFMFNTFGNLEVNPRAGLVALDFESGAILSLTGTARVIWDGPQVESFEGAERLLEMEVEAGWLWRDILRGWSPAVPSPHLRGTGTWSDGAEAQKV